MKKLSSPRICLLAVMGLLMACSSTNRESAQAPASDDLLELLTGFGESLSKRNFARAVDYMVPEEKAMMMENGQVPPDKQKMLLALPLQKLIRHPAIRVEKGHIAGIYSVLPNLQQGQTSAGATPEEVAAPAPEGTAENAQHKEAAGPMAAEATAPSTDEDQAPAADAGNKNDPRLKETVNKFFSAVSKKNWPSALALMNDNEKKFLCDEKGRLKESSKQRLSKIDQKNREALVLQDGKLTGVTLLLPSE